MKEKALSYEKPSEHGSSREQLLRRLKRKARKGEIPSNVYESFRDALEEEM